MGAAADFLGELAHGIHLDLFAILAFEQAHGALRLGFGNGHFFHGHGGLGFDGFVDQLLHFGDFFGGHLAAEGEVEAETFGSDIGALLMHFVTQDFPQRSLEQMGGGMMNLEN